MKHTSEGNIKKRAAEERTKDFLSLSIPDEDGVRKKKKELMQLGDGEQKSHAKKREKKKPVAAVIE
jgi:hypothetical protein